MKKKDEKETRKTEKEIEKLIKKAEHSKDKEDYTKAVAFYQEASRLAKSIDDRRAVDFSMDAARHSIKLGDDFKAGWSYKCAADHSFFFEDYNNTINFALKAIEHFSKSNSMYAVQWCYNILGKASEKIKDYDLAIKGYRKSLEIEYSEEIEKKLKDLLKRVGKRKIEEKG